MARHKKLQEKMLERFSNMLLEIVIVLTDHGPLIIFLFLVLLLDRWEGNFEEDTGIRSALFVAKSATLAVIVLPKLLRAVGEVLGAAIDLWFKTRRSIEQGRSSLRPGRSNDES